MESGGFCQVAVEVCRGLSSYPVEWLSSSCLVSCRVVEARAQVTSRTRIGGLSPRTPRLPRRAVGYAYARLAALILASRGTALKSNTLRLSVFHDYFFESRTSRLRGDSPDSSLSNARAGGTTADPRVCRRGGVVISVTSLAPAHAHAPPRRVSHGPSACVRLSMPPHAPSARPSRRAPARASHEHHAVARTHACDRLPSHLLRPRRPP